MLPAEPPTARNPWTVTLGWTPAQNSGRVGVMPHRHPVRAVWGLLAAGEQGAAVAEEHRCTSEEVAVLGELRRETLDELDAVTRDRNLLHRALTDLVESAGQPRAQWDRSDMTDAWGRARDALASAAGPRYPDTRYLLLCTLPERKSGRVTIGESRLPAAMVLEVVRAHGAEEAALQWPQLSRQELGVLAQLADDVAIQSGDGDD